MMEQQHVHEESILNFLKIIFKHKIVFVIGIIISGASSYFLRSDTTLFLNKAVVEFEITNEDTNSIKKFCESAGAKKSFRFYLPKQTTYALNAALASLKQDKKIFFDITAPIFINEVENNCPIFEAEVKFKTKYNFANRELTEEILKRISIRSQSYTNIYLSNKLIKKTVLQNERLLKAHILTLKPATTINLRGSPIVIFCVGVFLSFIVSLLLEAYLRQKKQLRPNQN